MFVDRARAFMGLFPLLCAACLEVPDGFGASAQRGLLALEARDAFGTLVPLDALPRRPALILEHPDGIAEGTDAIVLLSGAPDDRLIADLARAPLTAANRARAVDCELSPSGAQVVFAPHGALQPAASYTLAVAAWARSRKGAKLTPDGKPAVFALQVDADPEAGARATASWPADGASGIGTNLEAAVIAFDGIVYGAEDGVWLEGPDGLAAPAQIETGACEEIAPPHAGAFCARITPAHRLVPTAEYRLAVGSAARDGRGSPVGPFRAFFRTAAGPDVWPPSPLPPNCAVDELALGIGCVGTDDTSVTVRATLDEAAVARLELGTRALGAVAPNGRLVLRVTGLAPDTRYAARLALRDAAGNESLTTFELRTQAALPEISIVEVLADPLGPEPQQEFVELLNYGRTAIDLAGFALADRADLPGSIITTHARVEPQARALLVADGYDPNEGRDVPPPPGALLVRVGASLANAGLRNAGEPLFLRDPLGRRVSAAPATPRPRPGVCIIRVADDMRTGAPEAFAYDPDGRCTPGR
jgi:hypothetical protein